MTVTAVALSGGIESTALLHREAATTDAELVGSTSPGR